MEFDSHAFLLFYAYGSLLIGPDGLWVEAMRVLPERTDELSDLNQVAPLEIYIVLDKFQLLRVTPLLIFLFASIPWGLGVGVLIADLALLSICYAAGAARQSLVVE